MAEEIDVWRLASQLLKARGEHAETRSSVIASTQAGRMPEGVAFWKRVEAAIRKLRNVDLPARPH